MVNKFHGKYNRVYFVTIDVKYKVLHKNYIPWYIT